LTVLTHNDKILLFLASHEAHILQWFIAFHMFTLYQIHIHMRFPHHQPNCRLWHVCFHNKFHEDFCPLGYDRMWFGRYVLTFWYTSTRLYGVTSQKIINFIITPWESLISHIPHSVQHFHVFSSYMDILNAQHR
jgi:hypothetical protein